MGLISVTNDSGRNAAPDRLFTFGSPAGSPPVTTVMDSAGALAKLTTGAKTVLMRGPSRTFREDKRPFKDDFVRTASNGFGISPGGGNWSNTTGADSIFSVSSSLGRVALDVANASRFATLIDGVADVDMVTRWSMDELPTGNAASLGLVFGYLDPNNNYRARLSVSTTGVVQLILEKEVAGTVTTIGALTQVGTGWAANQYWLIRVQRVGTQLRAKAWLDGSAEPGAWLFDVADSSLSAGRVGFRFLASSGNTNVPFTFLIDYLDVTSATWPVPVVITHSWWVRTLSSPYSGAWSQAIDEQLRAWDGSTVPDALAYAQMYQTGALTVLRPDGHRLMGQAGYGPLNADGTLSEGADFHEYMGVGWTFPNGETMPAAGSSWEGNLDCSGFVRMIYGYHLGIPMCVSANYNGFNLPRVTENIGRSGPGVVVADGGTSVPDLDSLQIGDVVHFDADSSDPGVLDHNGIYIGSDTGGNLRFVNSRKTPHGPTFADLGGASRLDGTGTYATSLRLVRRF